MSTFTASHMRKNTRLSMPAQLQCSRSRAWEPGNEAMPNVWCSLISRPSPSCYYAFCGGVWISVCWWWAGLLWFSKIIFHFIIVQHVTCVRIAIIQLFESEQYEEAALHAATSPKVRVRVENVVWQVLINKIYMWTQNKSRIHETHLKIETYEIPLTMCRVFWEH